MKTSILYLLTLLLSAEPSASGDFRKETSAPASSLAVERSVEPDGEPQGQEPGVPEAKDLSRARYLLLSNNNVFEGRIEKTPQGYMIKRNGGKIYFDTNRVLMVADSLEEIYHYKSKRFPAHDAGEHLKLSQWCISNGLLELAEVEAKEVLKLDPSNADAARRVRYVQSQLNPEPTPAEQGDVRRVSARSSLDYSTLIQNFKDGHGMEAFDRYCNLEMVMLNRCASAGCHGSITHKGSFRLYQPPHGKQNQRITARNLNSILNHIDLQTPHQSAVLYYAVNAHGPKNLAPFGGVNDPSYKELRDWVYNVADTWSTDRELLAQRSTDNKDRLVRPDMPSSIQNHYAQPVIPASYSPGNDISSSRGFGAPQADDAPMSARRSSPIAPPASLQETSMTGNQLEGAVPRSPRKARDPYDPGAFNRGQFPSGQPSSLPREVIRQSSPLDSMPSGATTPGLPQQRPENGTSNPQGMPTDGDAPLGDSQSRNDNPAGLAVPTSEDSNLAAKPDSPEVEIEFAPAPRRRFALWPFKKN